MNDSHPYPPPPARRHGVSFWFALIFGIGFALSAGLNFLLLFAMVGLAAGQAEGRQGPSFREQPLVAGSGEKRILAIRIEGVISQEEREEMFAKQPSIVESVREQLRAAAKDPSIRGVLLLIDSPGGGVHASDELYRLVTNFRTRTGRPVYAHMGALCASGGYYVACAADQLQASPTTVTGSIGVIMSVINAEKLLTETLGLEATPITSGPHKDIASPFRALSPEEHAILQGIIDRMYARFITVIADNRAGRPLFADLDEAALKTRLRELGDGRIYHAEEALAAGLVDAIGYRAEAIDALRSAIDVADAPVVIYERRPQGLAALFQAQATPIQLGPSMPDIEGMLAPRFEYRWRPLSPR